MRPMRVERSVGGSYPDRMNLEFRGRERLEP